MKIKFFLLLLLFFVNKSFGNTHELFDPNNQPLNQFEEQFYTPPTTEKTTLSFDDQAIASILKRTVTIPFDSSVTNQPSIAYCCADIKYNKGSLKICEINPIPGIATSKYNLVIDDKKYVVYSPFWKAFWHYVKQFDIPVWFVGPVYKPEALEFDSFFEQNYTYHKNLDELANDPLFIKQSKKNVTDKQALSNYGGLIIYTSSFGADLLKANAIVDKFKQYYPNFLWLNDISKWFTGDKELMSRIFLSPQLQQFKPRWKSYTKNYSPDFASKIINDFDANMYVIKPTNGTWSGGVTIVPKNDLDATLELLFDSAQKNKKTGEKNLDYWKTDNNETFIVEEFIQSQTLTINGNDYNPTLRLAFIVTQERNTISMTLLGGGWKTPQIPLNQEGDLARKHITLGLPGEYCGQTIDPEDFAMMQTIMNTAGPKIYAEMLKNYERTKQDYKAKSL